jgi:predicted alpha/beta-hydrolase family hydrolase
MPDDSLSRAVFLCAHGAGGHKDDAGMQRLARALQQLDVVRFNFPYREKGSKRIDPMPVLKDAFLNQIKEKANGRKLIIGGRSMGGRVASMLAAEGLRCDGLLLAAYPLHPAGAPEKLRSAHLAAIRCPVLCLNGTRDPLCRRDLMERTLSSAGANWTMHWLDGADHSFHVLKSSGRTDADVDAEVTEAARRWLTTLPASAVS